MGPEKIDPTTGETVGGWCDNTANGAACFLIKSTTMRLNMEWDVAVTRGIGCNFLVCTALWLAQMSQEQAGPLHHRSTCHKP
jgi:formate/nitrite transporter FocA (FNT family)